LRIKELGSNSVNNFVKLSEGLEKELGKGEKGLEKAFTQGLGKGWKVTGEEETPETVFSSYSPSC
jgi:hypothetical protein